jgi:hypothetical protein
MSMFKQWLHQHKDRREALRTTGRFAALSVLAALGLSSVLHKPAGVSEDNCPETSLCKGCGILKVCSLPQAQTVRKTKQENRDA